MEPAPGPRADVSATATTTPASSTSRTGATSSSTSGRPRKGGVAWNMMSDVCKHCAHASCMEVCPTNAIIRTEFDTVYIQPDVCNGCRDCIAACPYHVIGFDEKSGLARKCTFCYDRLKANLTPACAKACPTESIKFGDLNTMRDLAGARLNQLRGQGMSEARLYGDKEYGGLHALFLLTDKPEAYGLPNDRERGAAQPQQRARLPGLTGDGRARRCRRDVRVPRAVAERISAMPQHFVASAAVGVVHRLVLLPRRAGGRRLPARHDAPPLRETSATRAWPAWRSSSCLPALAICPILLTLDLGRPLRFWHMLIDSRTFGLNFKYWSPMSVGVVGAPDLQRLRVRVLPGGPPRRCSASGLAARLARPARS